MLKAQKRVMHLFCPEFLTELSLYLTFFFNQNSSRARLGRKRLVPMAHAKSERHKQDPKKDGEAIDEAPGAPSRIGNARP
jgi:hypothetical protein